MFCQNQLRVCGQTIPGGGPVKVIPCRKPRREPAPSKVCKVREEREVRKTQSERDMDWFSSLFVPKAKVAVEGVERQLDNLSL